jgi:hypothetical protein
VTDPTHPLFGRRFRVVSISHPPHHPGHVTVAYRQQMRLRLPLEVTDLGLGNTSLVRAKFTREALLDFLRLVKECEGSCPVHPSASGSDSATI